MQQRGDELPPGAGRAQSGVAAGGVGHADVGGIALPCQVALLLAAVAALGAAQHIVHLLQDGFFAHAGLVGQTARVDVPRRGADALAREDVDGVFEVVQPPGVVAQVVVGGGFFQLELGRVGAAVQQHGEPLLAVFFDELVGVFRALVA